MKDHYDDSPVIAHLRRAYFGDESDEQIWEHFRRAFSLQGPLERRSDIYQIDAYLGEHAAPTRETADLISKRRQLADVDRLLRDAGR